MQQKRDFPTTTIMNIPFSKLSFTDTVTYLSNRIDQNISTQVVTANPEIVMYAREDQDYLELLKTKVDMIVADGIGVVYAAKMQKDPVTERVAGYDLLHGLMAEANQKGWKVYLLGANEEINQLAFERLQQDYPNATLIGRHHGYFKANSEQEKEIVEEIKTMKPDVLFVALGFPRQEQWIGQYQDQLQIPLAMGVGGSFDVLSGKAKRASVFWQKRGLEWFIRLLNNR